MAEECWLETFYEECVPESKPEIYDKAVELFDPVKNKTIYGEDPGETGIPGIPGTPGNSVEFRVHHT